MPPDRKWNNEPDDDAPAPDAQAVPLRRIASIGGVAQALFFIFFAFYISYHANPRGDGMEWLAIMPATCILVVFVAPGLLLGLAGRWLAFATALVAAGAVFNVLLFVQIAREFASKEL